MRLGYWLPFCVGALVAVGCGESRECDSCEPLGLGYPCRVEISPVRGEPYVEANSYQCPTSASACLSLDLPSNITREECLEDGGPPEVCAMHAPGAEFDLRSYCTCVCDGPSVGGYCTCDEGFECSALDGRLPGIHVCIRAD